MAIGSHLIDTIESRLYTCPNSKVSIEGTEVEIPNNAPGPIEDQIITPQIRMHYRDWGRPWLGPGQSPVLDVLALHGLGSSCHWYDILVPHLRNEFRFVAPDQRGHGQTDQPPGGYDWQTLATDVKDLIDSLRIHRAAVMGHSWGSSVARISSAARATLLGPYQLSYPKFGKLFPLPIDHILVPEGATGTTKVKRLHGSDHMGTVATFSFR